MVYGFNIHCEWNFSCSMKIIQASIISDSKLFVRVIIFYKYVKLSRHQMPRAFIDVASDTKYTSSTLLIILIRDGSATSFNNVSHFRHLYHRLN